MWEEVWIDGMEGLVGREVSIDGDGMEGLVWEEVWIDGMEGLVGREVWIDGMEGWKV